MKMWKRLEYWNNLMIKKNVKNRTLQLANQLDHQLVPSFFKASQSAEISSNNNNMLQTKFWLIREWASKRKEEILPSTEENNGVSESISLAVKANLVHQSVNCRLVVRAARQLRWKKQEYINIFSMEVYKLGWKQQGINLFQRKCTNLQPRLRSAAWSRGRASYNVGGYF